MNQNSQVPAQSEEQAPITVLVVDDDNNITELIRLGLRYEGFQVESSETGTDGLVAAQRLDPALIILDILYRTWMAWKSVTACARTLPRAISLF